MCDILLMHIHFVFILAKLNHLTEDLEESAPAPGKGTHPNGRTLSRRSSFHNKKGNKTRKTSPKK